jgi:hypothetical protein
MEKKKRKPYKFTPSCGNCDFKHRSIARDPCKSCVDLSNWENKKRGMKNAKNENKP